MTATLINAFLLALAAYAAIGLVFAVVFVLRAAPRIDPAAAAAPVRTRLLFIPGAAALWPLLIKPMRHPAPAQHPPAPMHPLIRRHALIWFTLAPTLIAILIALIALSPTSPTAAAP